MVPFEDVQHEMILLALDGELHTSPAVSKTATVLDVGTGTGTWACQLAQRNPEARVYGIDLRQVCPAEIPANVVFESVDVMTGFPFNTGTFDFVHSRLLIGGITDWDSYLSNLYRITKRQGIVECIEMELYTQLEDKALPSLTAWRTHMSSILLKAGLDPDAAVALSPRMKNAGFAGLSERVIDIPIGDWPRAADQKHIGTLALQFHESNMATWMKQSLVEQALMPSGAVDILSENVLRELKDSNTKAFWRWHFCYGQKAA